MSLKLSLSLDDSLVAYSSFHEGREESVLPITIKGADSSGNRELSFQIKSLPKHGILFEPGSDHIIKEDEILNQTDFPPWSGVTINYKGDKDFFTRPYQRLGDALHETDEPIMYESFGFSVLAKHAGEEAIRTSESAQCQISIINVNDPPTLNVPSTIPSFYKFSSVHWDSFCDQEGNFQCSNNSNLINGIDIQDFDQGIDFVRVDLKSKHGILTLNGENLRYAEFASCNQGALITSNLWSCNGTGIGDKEMTFITRPVYLNSIFSNLMYESLIEGWDNISLTIYDGIDGNCLSYSQHKMKYGMYDVYGPFTIHGNDNVTCYKVEKIFQVNVVKKPIVDTNKWLDFSKIPMQLWVAIIVLLSSSLILSLCSFCSKWWATKRKNLVKQKKRRRSRRKKRRDRTLKNSSQSNNENGFESREEVKENQKYIGDNATQPSGCQWIQYFDSASGEHYYEETKSRRVTWTKPNKSFVRFENE